MNIIIEPSFDKEGGQLSNIFVVVIKEGKVIGRSIDTHAFSEYDVLSLLQSTFHNIKDVRLCGWDSRININKILSRCFYHGISFPWYYNDRFGPRYRYSTEYQLDVSDFLTEYGVVGRGSTLSTTMSALLGGTPYNLESTDMSTLVTRCLVSTIMAIRCEVVRGTVVPSVHNNLVNSLWSGVNSSLSITEGNHTDALGVGCNHHDYSSILEGYRKFITIFPSPPEVKVK